MAGESILFDAVPPSTPDGQVPVERVGTATCACHKAHRAERFLKGPIPLSWIRDHIRDPADRLLLVLLAHSDMQKTRVLKVTADVLRDAGVESRKVVYRALSALEANGVLGVLRKRGRRPVVRLEHQGIR